MKKGFTLAELLITIVILAVLAAVALPDFTHATEKAKANQAIAYLRVIRTGEQMYFARNAVYWTSCANSANCTDAELRANIGAEASGSGYTFGIAAGAGGNATTFTATANNNGLWSISIIQNGTITPSSVPSYITVPAN